MPKAKPKNTKSSKKKFSKKSSKKTTKKSSIKKLPKQETDVDDSKIDTLKAEIIGLDDFKIKPGEIKQKVDLDKGMDGKEFYFDQIVKMIHFLSEDSDIIPNILEESCKIMGANATVLVLWENNLGFYNTAVGFPEELSVKGQLIHPNEGISGRIIDEKKTVTIRNYSKSIYAFKLFKELNFQFAIGTPIILRDEIVGNVNFYYDKTPVIEQHNLIKFVEELSEQLSIVILNSRIYQELHEKSVKLTETVSFLNLLLNTSPYIIIDINSSGKIKFWNKTATEVLGYNSHEMANKKLPLAEGKNSEKFLEIFVQSRRSGTSFNNVILDFITKRKRTKVINTRIIPIIRDGKDPESILLYGTDISKKVFLEEKIQQVEKQIGTHRVELARLGQMLDDTKINLEQAEKMALIGNMYGNLAHQINNPLMIILSLVQLLIDAKDEGDLITENESLYDFLMEIPKEIEKIKEIIKILRVYSEITIQTKMREILVLNTINDAIRQAKAFFRGDRIKINFINNLTVKNPKILGRYQHLLICFYNILENAIISLKIKDIKFKYSNIAPIRKWDKSVKVNVENLFINKIPFIRFKIYDSGLGIEESEIRNVTKPFYSNWPDLQVWNQELNINSQNKDEIIKTDYSYLTKKKKHSCGMGLTITNTIVKAHSGHIYAKSKFEKGTTFIVDLPLL